MNCKWFSCRLFLLVFFGIIAPSALAQHIGEILGQVIYFITKEPPVGVNVGIQFVNLSEECTIRTYTIRGDLVKTIQHDNLFSGAATWKQISDYGQYVKSGIYFYHVSNQQREVKKGNLVIINGF